MWEYNAPNCLKGGNIFLKRAVNWAKSFQSMTTTPQKYPKHKNSKIWNVQKEPLSHFKRDLFIFYQNILEK